MNTPTIEASKGKAKPARSKAAIAAAFGFIGVALFELSLGLGAPLGRAAWGGYHTYLPTGLRIASVAAVFFWLLMALMVLRRGGYRVPPFTFQASRIGTWVLVGLLSLGVLMNAASGSGWERYLQAPITAILAVLCFIVARSGSPTRDAS
jgi:hypothetical protein